MKRKMRTQQSSQIFISEEMNNEHNTLRFQMYLTARRQMAGKHAPEIKPLGQTGRLVSDKENDSTRKHVAAKTHKVAAILEHD